MPARWAPTRQPEWSGDGRQPTANLSGANLRLANLIKANLSQASLIRADLRLANLFLDPAGGVWVIDFGFGELAASDLLLATDLAELVRQFLTPPPEVA